MERRKYHSYLKNVVSLIMVMIITMMMVLPTFAAVSPSNVGTTGYDVILVIDNSRSIWAQQEQRYKAISKIVQLAVGSDIRVGGVFFADHIYKTQRLTSFDTKEGAQEILNNFIHMTEKDEGNIDTNIGNGLEAALGLLDNDNQSRKKVFILFSDGINENAQGDKAYKDSANAKTKEQVAKIQEAGIDLYCVYLEKEYNKESYLREIVNYFNLDNHYDDTRFKKVTEDKINSMADQFIEVFYEMQHDMKYRKISLDSSGKMNFYVPSMGVSKVQIYLDSDIDYVGTVTDPNGETPEMDSWSDGNSSFATVNNPMVGEWTLSVSSDDLSSVRGTIAYYTQLDADVEVVSEQENVGKNDNIQLKAHFYDASGQEIVPDSTTTITGVASLKKEDGDVVTYQLPYTLNGSSYESSEFSWGDYGTSSYQLNLIYDDFVDLVYDFNGSEVKPLPLVVYNQSDNFVSHKSQDKEKFSIKLSDLVYDPNGEDISIVSVSNLNDNNSVEAVLEDGYVVVNAAQQGDIKFDLNVMNTSGMTETVSVEGKVIDKGTKDMAFLGIAVVIIVIIILFILHFKKKKGLKTKVENLKKDLDTSLENIDTMIRRYKTDEEEGEKAIETKFGYLDMILSGTDGFAGIYNLMQSLSRDQILEYENHKENKETPDDEKLITYLDGGYEKKIHDSYSRKVEGLISIKKWCEKQNSEKKNGDLSKYSAGELKKIYAELKESYDKSKKRYKDATAQIEQLHAYNKTLEQNINFLGDVHEAIAEMLSQPINCSLIINVNGMRGAKANRRAGHIIEGYYMLDQVSMMGGGTLANQMSTGCSTDIYVYGYGEDGLILKSKRPFKIKDKAIGGAESSVKEVVLERNHDYTLICVINPAADKADVTRNMQIDISVN